MPGKTDPQPDPKVETEGGEGEELIKIGETEYKPEELQGMVDVAGRVKAFEEKSGTDFDGLTSSWGKRGEEIGKLKAELEEATKEPEPEPTGEELTAEQQVKQAQEQARKLGIVLKEDLDKFVDEKVSAREQARELLGKCVKLEKKLDGEDGRPQFKTDEVLEHMKETGIRNPQDAYDLKHKSELTAWMEKKLSEKKPAGLATEEGSTAGGKTPPKIKITKDNLEEIVGETLRSGGS